MEWTDKRPTENGYYWARSFLQVAVGEWIESIEIVEVEGFDIEEPEAYTIGSDMSDALSTFTHWYGPIHPPEFTGAKDEQEQ